MRCGRQPQIQNSPSYSVNIKINATFRGRLLAVDGAQTYTHTCGDHHSAINYSSTYSNLPNKDIGIIYKVQLDTQVLKSVIHYDPSFDRATSVQSQ